MRDFRVNAWVNKSFSDILIQSPFTTKHEFTILNAYLNYHEAPLIFEGKEMKFTLTLENNFFIQQWINVKWHLPEGFEITPSKNVAVSLEQYHCNIGKTDLEFTVTCHNLDTSRYDLLIEISSVGRHTKCVIPVVLINS